MVTAEIQFETWGNEEQARKTVQKMQERMRVINGQDLTITFKIMELLP